MHAFCTQLVHVSDLDSESGHFDAALSVTINNSRQFLISSVEQLSLCCRGLFEQFESGCAGYLNNCYRAAASSRAWAINGPAVNVLRSMAKEQNLLKPWVWTVEY